jgi:hypothetical protein
VLKLIHTKCYFEGISDEMRRSIRRIGRKPDHLNWLTVVAPFALPDENWLVDALSSSGPSAVALLLTAVKIAAQNRADLSLIFRRAFM